ncbi:hypothetical protein M3B38_07830 [Dietzia cinnamea]|uniref:hypothetical protein n=1 Tax=Dietzia cinnamea TaxID=321318 RepID=UPI0021A8664B|nr:hypothetical protein [Dietzia cinnamea]MCT1711887.1 hypothetical protein [Dietzia cinnamea]
MDEQTQTDSGAFATVGLMADPGVPRRIAVAIADDLAEDLGRELGGRWRVEVDQETLPLGPEGEIRLTEHAPRLLQQHGWDFVLYLTDLATHPDGVPVLYDVSGSTAAALVCVPVLGVFRVRSKVRELALGLVRSGTHRDGLGVPGTDDLPPARQRGVLSRVRLLAGMVHNNRPTRMVTTLSGVVAAGAGSGAFGIFYGSIASLAVELHALRLLLLSVMGVLTLVLWLILRNGLWTRRNDAFAPGNRRMDNAATVLTVGAGVGIMFVGLFVAMFVLALTVMDADYLATQLDRPAVLLDYVHLAWLSSCLGAFAGALGSNFDDEDAVRESTYSLRWHERRKMFDSYQGREGDPDEQQEQQRIEREHEDDDNDDDNDDARGHDTQDHGERSYGERSRGEQGHGEQGHGEHPGVDTAAGGESRGEVDDDGAPDRGGVIADGDSESSRQVEDDRSRG